LHDSSSSEKRFLGGVDLLQDPGSSFGGNGSGGSEANVVSGDSIQRRVHVPEGSPTQKRFLPPVLRHPRVRTFSQISHRRRHVRVVLVQRDCRPHLVDHVLRLLHVLLVRRGQCRGQRKHGGDEGGGEGQELAAAWVGGGGGGGGEGGGDEGCWFGLDGGE